MIRTVDRAVTWLAEYLTAHGAIDSAEVKRAALIETGISTRTLHRARHLAGVAATLDGRCTVWSLDGRTSPAEDQDHDKTAPGPPPPTDPPCPSCGHLWPSAQAAPLPPWWCPHCGHRYAA